jgi:dTDP-4-dehydrorhamnose reductase
MRVLLFGAGGQVGHELAGALGCLGEVIAKGRELDLADRDALKSAIDEARPDAIVNAASYNDVDGAEKDEAGARAINADAVEVIGEAAKKIGATLVHYSTDFVFDGAKGALYTEEDATNPLGAYGRSKREGEARLLAMKAPAFVLRTAWVYSIRRKSFVLAILKAARERERLTVVDDQIGNPTFCRDLAIATALLLHRGSKDYGLYHLASRDFTSRYDLACAAVELDPRKELHKVKTIDRIRSSELSLPAKRPTFAPLDCSKAKEVLGLALPPWRDALSRALVKSMLE